MAENKQFASYSEERLNKDFQVTLLFSERLDFEWAEVIAAIEEDYPEMAGWQDSLGLGSAVAGDVSVGFLPNELNPDLGSLNYISGPGRAGQPSEDVYAKANTFPGARDAYEKHTCYLDLALSSRGTDLASRFRAARALNCISAVFAKLPVCLAVWFPDADLILSPQQWADAAEEARKEEWPFSQWISFNIGGFQGENGQSFATISTIGMAAFNGTEVSVLGYPGDRLQEGALMARNTCWMLLNGGSRFNDGDTIGVEGDQTAIKIRLAREGTKPGGSDFPMQTDVWMLFHPEGYFNDLDLLGTPNPSPVSFDQQEMEKAFAEKMVEENWDQNASSDQVIKVNKRPDPGWFKKLVRKVGLH